MRSAIYTINAVRRANNRSEGVFTAILLILRLACQAVTTSITRGGWCARLAVFGRQPTAWWRLRQRLASCQLSVPLWQVFSARQIGEIDQALNLLGLAGGEDAGATWRQLCAPFVTGDCAGIDAAGSLLRLGIVKPQRCGPAGDALLHVLARSAIVTTSREAGLQRRNVDIEARVRLLVSLGADPDQPNAFGDVPLQLAWERASELGHRIAGTLLETGCNSMKRDRFGATLLHRAARSNNLAVVRGWCDAGLHTNPTGGLRDGRALLQTPLMYAVMAGHRRCVEVLIDRERHAIAFGEAQRCVGLKPMESRLQQADSATRVTADGERLFSQGCDQVASVHAHLDFSDTYGATALHWAIDYGRADLAELLLEWGADRSKHAGRVPGFSWTCMQLAAARTKLQAARPILPLLLHYGVHPNEPSTAVDQMEWQRQCDKGFQR